MLKCRPSRAAVTALICAAAAAGCGLGPGEERGETELTVTRDYGSQLLTRQDQSLRESDDVLSLLDRSTDLETRYGGRFVQSIDGISGDSADGRRRDWFFYVNGIESPIGSADYRPDDGDRIWWDHHDWTSVMRVPAVVGSWPEPFVHGFRGDHWPTVLVCAGDGTAACSDVARIATRAGIDLDDDAGTREPATDGDSHAARLVIGTWDELAGDPVAGLLSGSPSDSGVFARFSGSGSATRLELLDVRAEVAETLGAGAGLVAALRPEDGPPTWVISGTDAAGVEAAIALLGDPLRDHYAVASAGGAPTPLPEQ
jgi:hypothetical protein